MITVLEMGAARHLLRMQQLAKTSEERAQMLQPTLEINTGYGNWGLLHQKGESVWDSMAGSGSLPTWKSPGDSYN